MVEETFQTDPISALGLPSPISIGRDATIGAALAAVQRHGMGYVLVVEDGRPVGIMSEREVLMKVVARDVKYDENVASHVATSGDAYRVTRSPPPSIVKMAAAQHSIVDGLQAVAVLRTFDSVRFLAGVPGANDEFAARPHQLIAEGSGPMTTRARIRAAVGSGRTRVDRVTIPVAAPPAMACQCARTPFNEDSAVAAPKKSAPFRTSH